MVTGEVEHEGKPSGVGLFGLWGENIVAGFDMAALRTDPVASINHLIGDNL